MSFDYDQYLRLDKFPTIFCPGCGDGIILKATLRAIDHIGLDKDQVMMVSGIGCSSRTSGDVDGTAIGGNHLIHAARRNIDITVLLFNNWIYGMTGGQVSPATPTGDLAATAPFGSIEPNFDIVQLAKGAGASFAARETVAKPIPLERVIEKAIRKKGFSLVEIMTPCPTMYGRRNKAGGGVQMIEYLKDHSVSQARYAQLEDDEEKDDAIVTGTFVDEERPEYTDEYRKLVERVRAH